MKNWVRKLILFIFFFLFIIVGPTLILYTLGYRFDLEKKKISQTGGIFIKATPNRVDIFLNEKFVKKTDFFLGSALIENLLPRKYKLRVSKPGYLTWEKELEVEEKKVTEVKNLILFPEKVEFFPLIEKVNDFWLSLDGKKIIWKEITDDGWELKIYSIERNIRSRLVKESDFSKERSELLNLKFDEQNLNLVEVELKIGENVKNFLIDLTKNQIFEKEKGEIPSNVICFKKGESNFYFFEKPGFLYLGGTNFEKLEKLNDLEFEIDGNCEIELFQNFVFLKRNGDLYFLNQEKKEFEKIMEKIKGFKVSPNQKKLVLFSDFEIILFLEGGEKIFLHRFSNKIESLFWINENYLILKIGDEIKISEIDWRDKINLFNIAQFENGKLFFSFQDQKIYLLKENTVFQSTPLI